MVRVYVTRGQSQQVPTTVEGQGRNYEELKRSIRNLGLGEGIFYVPDPSSATKWRVISNLQEPLAEPIYYGLAEVPSPSASVTIYVQPRYSMGQAAPPAPITLNVNPELHTAALRDLIAKSYGPGVIYHNGQELGGRWKIRTLFPNGGTVEYVIGATPSYAPAPAPAPVPTSFPVPFPAPAPVPSSPVSSPLPMVTVEWRSARGEDIYRPPVKREISPRLSLVSLYDEVERQYGRGGNLYYQNIQVPRAGLVAELLPNGGTLTYVNDQEIPGVMRSVINGVPVILPVPQLQPVAADGYQRPRAFRAGETQNMNVSLFGRSMPVTLNGNTTVTQLARQLGASGDSAELIIEGPNGITKTFCGGHLLKRVDPRSRLTLRPLNYVSAPFVPAPNYIPVSPYNDQRGPPAM